MRQLSCFFVRAIKDMRKISKTIWLIVLILLSFLFPDDDGFIVSQAEAAGKIPHIVGANDQSFFFVQNSLEIQSRGQLLPGKTYPVQAPGTTTHAITVADFNKDGHLDAAVCNRNGGTVDVFLRVADPLLPYEFVGTSIPIPGAGQFHAIGSGDFDKDGLVDLVVVSAGGPVYVYKNTAPNIGKSFTAFAGNYTAGGYPHDVVVADFDQDGNLDFAVANAGTGVPVFVFYGNGDGSFVPEEIRVALPGGHPENIFVGDFNVDGLPDLGIDSTANGGNHSSLVLLINEKGEFLSTNAIAIDLGETGYITAMTAGDFVSDRWQIPDYAVSLDNDDNARLVMVEAWKPPDPKAANPLDGITVNPARNWFFDILLNVPQSFPALTPWDFKSADFSNDGQVDLSLSYWDRNNESGVMILQGDGRGNLSYLSQSSTGTNRAGSYQSMHEVYWDDDLSNAKCSDFVNADAFCNDGIPCTDDRCNRGQCEHAAHDELCSGLNNECRTGYCDLSLGCQGQPANEGQRCEVGSFCNQDAVCRNGECLGNFPCDDGFDCTEDRCDETNDRCTNTSRNNFCPIPANQCHETICDPNADPFTGCFERSRPEGAGCDDGLACTGGGFCQDDICMSGKPLDCTTRNDVCGTWECVEPLGCVVSPQNENAPCGKECGSGSCTNGQCSINTMNVGAKCGKEFECNVGACDQGGGCRYQATPGVPCGKELECNVGACDQWGGCRYQATPGVPCGRELECSVGACDQWGGCRYQATPGVPCGKEFECNVGACDQWGGCRYQATPGVSCTDEGCGTGNCDQWGGCHRDQIINEGQMCESAYQGNLICNADAMCHAGKCLTEENCTDPSWSYDLGVPAVKTFSTIAVGDINNDGQLEVVTVHDQQVYVTAANGQKLWTYSLNEPLSDHLAIPQYSPRVFDIDKDGFAEIIVTDGTHLYVIKQNTPTSGELVWKYSGTQISRDFAVADIDGKGAAEVVIIESLHRILVINDNNHDKAGDIVWEYTRLPTLIERVPLTTDIDGDDQIDVLFSDRQSIFTITDVDKDGIIANSEVKDIADIPLLNGQYSFAVGDVDGDPWQELVVSGTINGVKGLYVIKPDTSIPMSNRIIWGYAFTEDDLNLPTYPMIADVNGDGQVEIVVSDSKYINVLTNTNHDNQMELSWRAPRCNSLTSPALADFDRDGRVDIVCLDHSGSIYGLSDHDGDGKGDRRFSSPAKMMVIENLAVADSNNDGQLEIIYSPYQSNPAQILIQTFTVKHNAKALEQNMWPMIYHDAGNTNSYIQRTPFKRGDVDGNGKVDISDPIGLLKHLFLGGAEPPCKEAANAEDDDKLDITDAIAILQHLFLGKGPLAEPFNHCGVDPAGQGRNLGCASYPASSCGP